MVWEKKDACMSIEEVIERNTGMSIDEFLDPGEPTEISGLSDVVNRIEEAIDNNEKITIFGDYDVDGITASAILWSVFKILGNTANIRLPKRFSEGFGFSLAAADEISEGLLITVDNGISAIEPIRKIKEKGVSVIVVDHHLAGDELPNADYIIDPHVNKVSETDFEEWCGAGLAYRIALELLKHYLEGENEKRYLRTVSYIEQLATLGTICDVMPLVRDNRAIVLNGLREINERPCKGLNALLIATNVEYVDESVCGFKIGPIINAAGRMLDDGAMLAFDVLTACARGGEKPLDVLATELVELNEKRKSTVFEAMEKAENVIIDDCLYGNKPLIVCMENVNEGIVGIVAGRLAEKYKTPTIVLTDTKDGLLKGSARSYGGIDIKVAMDAAKDCIEKYGGHSGAGGLTVDPDHLEEIYFKMNGNIVSQTCGSADTKGADTIYYDLEMPIEKLAETIEHLSKYAPFGQGNDRIVFKIDKFTLSPKAGQFAQTRGVHNEHVSLFGNGFVAIGFGLSDKYDENGAKEVSCVGMLSKNYFMGKSENQIEMLDFVAVNAKKTSVLADILAAKMKSL